MPVTLLTYYSFLQNFLSLLGICICLPYTQFFFFFSCLFLFFQVSAQMFPPQKSFPDQGLDNRPPSCHQTLSASLLTPVPSQQLACDMIVYLGFLAHGISSAQQCKLESAEVSSVSSCTVSLCLEHCQHIAGSQETFMKSKISYSPRVLSSTFSHFTLPMKQAGSVKFFSLALPAQGLSL